MNSHKSSRFECPSSSLMLRDLLKHARGVLWSCLVLAVAAHIGSSALATFQVEKQTAKPLTTKFVKREPRLTKPLEMKKRPQPKRRRIQRKMISVKAKVSRRDVSKRVRPVEVIASLAKPRGSVRRAIQSVAEDMDPQTVAARILSTKEVENAVDTSLEMLDIDAMDTGKYYAMVVQDQDDKRTIKGFLHLGLVYSTQKEEKTLLFGNPITFIRHVVDAMNNYTEIKTDVSGYFSMDDEELLKVPWVFFNIEGESFWLTSSEALGLGTYLKGGGFLFSETGWAHRWDDLTGQHVGELHSIRNMFEESLELVGHKYGKDWTYEVFPSDHPMYHCYFDMDRAPAVWNDNPEARRAASDVPVRGAVIDGRVVGVIETGDYERWLNRKDMDGTRHLHFFVNMVVFALTQEGGITNQVMHTVR